MNFKKHIIPLLFLLIPFILISNEKADSLQKLLDNKELQLEQKTDVLYQLLVEYRNILPQKGIDYAEEALELLPTDKYDEKRYDLLLGIGDSYRFTSQDELATEYYFKALRLAEQLQDSFKRARTLNNIGLIYNNIKDYDLALEYIKNSTNLFKKLQDTTFLIQSYNNLASIYWNRGDIENAVKYYNLAFEISKTKNDLFGLLHSYNNLGIVYLSKEEFYTALEYFSRSLEISKDLNDQLNRATSLNNLGQVFISLEKYATAEKNIEKALSIAKDINARAIEADSYYYLSKLYELTGDYKSALEFSNKFNKTKDSIYSEEKNKKIQKLQEEYKLQKKDAKIALLEKDKEYSKNILIFTIVSVILLILVGILLFSKYREKKRINKTLTDLNNELDQKNRELENTNATKDKIFTLIAHDLKNPLSGFRNITSVLVDYYNDMSKEEIQDSLRTIRESSNNLMMLLENLLTWSKLQKDEIDNQPQKVVLNFIIEKYIEYFKVESEKKNIDIKYENSEEIYAYCDTALISVVIKNLISNAIKYSEKGSLIKIDTQCIDSKAYFTIRDNGIGIEERKLQNIFEINSSQDSRYGTDGERGTGLGLILSKSFVSMNDGEIWIESEEGNGTAVTFAVPSKH